MYPAAHRGLSHLPTLTPVLARLLALVEDPDSSAAELEGIIRHDPSLTAVILRAANSAYYAFRHEIISLRQAVVALGNQEVRTVCLGACLVQFVSDGALRPSSRMDLLWLHAIAAGEAGRLLARKSGSLEPDLAFTCGLLHDLGKVVLEAYFPDDADAVAAHAARYDLGPHAAEEALGFGHAGVGGMLAQAWGLPAGLAAALEGHHGPAARLLLHPEAALAHLADALAHEAGLGSPWSGPPPTDLPAAMEALGLGPTSLAACRQELAQRRESIESLWRVLLGR